MLVVLTDVLKQTGIRVRYVHTDIVGIYSQLAYYYIILLKRRRRRQDYSS